MFVKNKNMRDLFTKELDGTLLIVKPNGDTYEVKRNHHSDIVIDPDKNTPELNNEESDYFKKLYRQSSAYYR